MSAQPLRASSAAPQPSLRAEPIRRQLAWQRFLAEVYDQAQARRFETTWPITVAQDEAIPGLHVTEHAADDECPHVQRVIALMEQQRQPARTAAAAAEASGDVRPRECPPCNGDCLAGDDCAYIEHAREQRAARRQARADAHDMASVEQRHPWLWVVYGAVIGLTIYLSTRWPWGWAG